MTPLIITILAASIASLVCSTLTYALRHFSRARLEAHLARSRRSALLEPTVRHAADLIFITAVGRMLANIVIVLCSIALFERKGLSATWRYTLAILLSVMLHALFSVAIPTALARYLGEAIIAAFIRPLYGMRVVMLPITKLMHIVDRMVLRFVGRQMEAEPELLEREILSVVEEGEKEGVVDKQERRMIESVIEFRDTQVNQTMTSRPEIVAIELGASLDEVKRTIEESGHSRLPVYDGTLDHIVGILYARDLLKHLGESASQFDLRSAMRPAVFVPATKPLRDLLHEFRINKVHIAIVLDEYGGTAGLVTIEDILEELVGEISDEHEPQSPATLKKISDGVYDVDARIYIGDFNRRLNLHLPEDTGYDTLGGFISHALGRIPQVGATFEHGGIRYTVTEAEPQRVKRLRVEIPRPAPAAQPQEARSAH